MPLKDMTHYWRSRMAKTRMPMGRPCANTTEDLGNRIQSIQRPTISTSKEYIPRCSILDKKMKRMKFNKSVIIKGNFVHGKEMLAESRNM